MIDQGLIQSFLDYCMLKRRFSSLTIENYERDIEKLVSYTKKQNVILTLFDKQWCRNFVSYETINGQNNRSIARRISSYRTFWDFLIRVNVIEQNPWRLIRLPKMSRKLPHIIPTKAMISFLDNISIKTAKSLRDRVVCECLYGIGLRVSELVAISLDDINLKRGECRVIGKRDKERIVFIGDATCKIITLYLKEVWCLWKKTNSKTLILNKNGDPVSVRTIQRIVKQCSVKQGINPPLTPHILRHCYASDLYKGGADISVIKELLGHDNLSTTEIYTHVAMDELKETITLFHPHGKGKGRI